MKKLLSILFLLCAGIFARAESVSLTDYQAETYIYNAKVTSPDEVQRIHAWYRGLKHLNMFTNIVLMSSYRVQHGAASGSTLISMVGGNGTINGAVPQTTNGLTFTNFTGNYVAYANPLQSAAVAAYSIMVACDVNPSTNSTSMALVGSTDVASARGPQLWAHGSVHAGFQPHFANHSYSSDGTGAGQPGDMISSASTIRTRGITTGPQMLTATFAAGQKSLTGGFDSMGIATGTFGTVWNNGANWRVGQTLAASQPLSGNIAMIIVANRSWEVWEVQAIRRLYHKTLGAGYMPDINFIVEGDSESAGVTGEYVWCGAPLWTNSLLNRKIQVRNLALSGAQLASMTTDYPTSAAPARVDFDYAPRQYFFLFGGNNDVAASPYTVIDQLKTIWNYARADGFKVVAFTIMKTVGTDAYPDNRKTLNTFIRNSAAFYDILIDMDQVPEIQNYNDTALLGSTAATFQDDRTHLTSLGHFYLSRFIASKFNYP